MFLGISYNRWHLYLTLAGTVAIFLASAMTFLSSLFIFWRLALAALISFLVWSYAQMANETWQLFSKNIYYLYGSYENFISDSKDDWRNCWIGYSAGLTLALIIYWIIL